LFKDLDMQVQSPTFSCTEETSSRLSINYSQCMGSWNSIQFCRPKVHCINHQDTATSYTK